MFTIVLFAISLMLAGSFYLGRAKALRLAQGSDVHLLSLPSYHGYYLCFWGLIPALLVSVAWLIGESVILQASLSAWFEGHLAVGKTEQILFAEIRNLASGTIPLSNQDPEVVKAAEAFLSLREKVRYFFVVSLFGLTTMGLFFAYKRVSPRLQARQFVERGFLILLIFSSTVAILTTLGIVVSLLFESLRFFQLVSPVEFLFGTHWSPQIAIRSDQVGSSGGFGAIPLFVGTGLIAFIAMCVAVPCGLMSAIYFSEYAGKKVRAVAKPALEVLAGVPTVVYGFFAALTVAPWLVSAGDFIGLGVSTESALAAGVVMGLMIIPFVSSLSDDVIHAVPQSLRDGSLALGATKSETIKRVVMPAALPGVIGAILLAVSRAIGETMIVVMAAGLAAHLTLNPLSNVTTVTVQIVTTLVGDQEFESAKTLSAFALGLILFLVTLVLNVIALRVVKKYREKYE